MYNISYFVYLLEQQQQQENKQTSEGQHVPDQTQHSDATSTVSGKLSNMCKICDSMNLVL